MNTKMRRKQKLPAAELRALGTNQELIHCRIAPPDPRGSTGRSGPGEREPAPLLLGGGSSEPLGKRARRHWR
jgi:hypothetical protein